MRKAQRFNVGCAVWRGTSPEGTTDNLRDPSAIPSGLSGLRTLVPCGPSTGSNPSGIELGVGMVYRLLVGLEMIEVLDNLPKRMLERLLDQLHTIRSFPANHSDYHEQDAVARRVEICIFSGWAIHYWTDFADRQVQVLFLKSADK